MPKYARNECSCLTGCRERVINQKERWKTAQQRRWSSNYGNSTKTTIWIARVFQKSGNGSQKAIINWFDAQNITIAYNSARAAPFSLGSSDPVRFISFFVLLYCCFYSLIIDFSSLLSFQDVCSFNDEGRLQDHAHLRPETALQSVSNSISLSISWCEFGLFYSNLIKN